MPTEQQEIKINFLGRDFKIRCQTDEVPALEEAALFLEDKMRNIAGDNENKLINTDRFLVVVALNLASEMVAQNKNVNTIQQRLQLLETKLAEILARSR